MRNFKPYEKWFSSLNRQEIWILSQKTSKRITPTHSHIALQYYSETHHTASATDFVGGRKSSNNISYIEWLLIFIQFSYNMEVKHSKLDGVAQIIANPLK